MTNRAPIIAIGDALIDLLQISASAPDLPPQWVANVGGAPANVAAGIAKLGGASAFAGAVGQDHFGQLIQSTLAALTVNLDRFTKTAKAPTTLALVTTAAGTGERSFAFYHRETAYHYYSPEDFNRSVDSAIGGLHFVANSLTTATLQQTVDQAITATLSSDGIISFDINYRAGFWSDETTAKRVIQHYLSQAHILKFSEEELDWLRDDQETTAYFQQCFQQSSQLMLIAVTLGECGVSLITRDHTISVPTLSVTPVDTTGAGDAFMAGLRYQLANAGVTASTLAAYLHNTATVAQIALFACACGALTVTKPGAIPALPTRDEVEQALQAATQRS